MSKEKVITRPKSRNLSGKDLKQITAENEAMLEVRRILNDCGIHHSSRVRPEGYTHALKEDTGEYILYFSVQSKEGGDKRKVEIAKKMFDILSTKGFRVVFSKGNKGLRVYLGKSVIEKKIQNTKRSVEIKEGELHLNSTILLDDDVLIQLVLEKPESFQEKLISRMKPKIVSVAIEKALSKQ